MDTDICFRQTPENCEWLARSLEPLGAEIFPPRQVLIPRHRSLAVTGRTTVSYEFMSVEELQSAVAQLPAEELDRFSRWLEEFLADQWDQRIEADILAGRLDAAGRRADEELEAGRCTPLIP